MIFSSIDAAAAKCQWPECFEKAFAFLRNPELANMPVGRYEIDGDRIYAMIQEQVTALAEEKRAESHDKYIDIQFLIQGEERQGFTPLRDGLEKEEHPERDINFYPQVKCENFVQLRPGDFTIYFTNDIHLPNCAVHESMKIKKVVVKIEES